MKKRRLYNIFAILISLTPIIIAGILLYQHFIHVKINKIEIRTDNILNEYKNMGVIFNENGEETFIPFVKMGIKIKTNSKTYDYIKDHLNKDISFINTPISFNDENLHKYLVNMNNKRHGNTFGNIGISENGLYLIEGTQGNLLNTNSLEKDIKDNGYNKNITINLNDYYYDTDNSNAEDLIKRVNNWHIDYTNGFSINVSDFYGFIYTNHTISGNELHLLKCDELFDTIDKKIELGLLDYDTIGNERRFISHMGETISVNGGTWGDIQDSDKETEYIISSFESLTSSENRLPIIKQDMNDEIPSDFIEVSKDDQHLWYHKDGKIIMESDVVTGRPNGHSTPTGIFYISERVKEKDLRGLGYVSHVHRWMRLTGNGVGLHDATWRGRFGGTIYRSNGSHGCINLPEDFAYELYDNVTEGTCVVVY